MTATLGFAFLAGIVTLLSPCVLPLLPVILASAAGDGRARPIGVVLGFTGSFTLATLALAFAVRQFDIPPDANRLVAGWLLLGLGLVMTVPALGEAFESRASLALGRLPAARAARAARATGNGFAGGLAAGCGLGLAWSPCVGPIMASVITLALNREVGAEAVAVTLAFSLGTALPMAAVMIGGRAALARADLRRRAVPLRRVFGLTTVLVGVAILTDADRQVQGLLLTWFPNWEASLTGWEFRLGR